jgi:hypothetical protein
MVARHYLCLLVCGVLAGCRPPPATTTSPAEVEVSLRTPQDAARSLVELLRAHLGALARHEHAAADGYRDQIAREVVARDDIMARFNALSVRTARGEAEVLPRLVESWASAVAYYAGGLDLEHMRLSAMAGDSGKGVVEIPAHGPGDEARLDVACIRGADEKWRVIGIEFGLPPASQPATRAIPRAAPASQAATTSAP